MNSKFKKGIVPLVLAIFLLATFIVQPVSATTPEELNFTVEHVYIVPTDSTMFGVWESSGVLESAGEIYESYFWAGWNEDWWFVKNLHSEITLFGTNGKIRIKAQTHENDFEPFGLLDLEGSWVIVEATGDYAGLRGQGTVDFDGMFYWSCPPNDYGIAGPCIVGIETYTGQGHFDP
jgi:hypothetical protein